jgi:hypothetical protein
MSIHNSIGVPFRAASGALAVGEFVPFSQSGAELEKFVRALVHLHVTTITTPDGDDEIDFFVQTAYGDSGFADSGEDLDGAIDDTQQAIPVDDASTFVPGDVIRIGTERMLVTASDNAAPGVLTVERGFAGDPRAAAVDGADIDLLQVTWEDVANVHFAVGDNGNTAEAFIAVGEMAAGVAVFAHSDRALADDTDRNLPLGDRLRIVTVLTGADAPTYAYSAQVSFYS